MSMRTNRKTRGKFSVTGSKKIPPTVVWAPPIYPNVPVLDVPISAIRLHDFDLMGGDTKFYENKIRNGEPIPILNVEEFGPGVYELSGDGHHRYWTLKKLKIPTIRIQVVPEDEYKQSYLRKKRAAIAAGKDFELNE